MANISTINTGKTKAFRGKDIEELKKMEMREFAQFLTSRERRTILRNNQLIQKFMEKSRKDIAKGKMPKTQVRELIIFPEMIGWTVGVHNGKEYVSLKIVDDMIGHRLGEFALTRKFTKHGAAGIGATKSSSSLSVK